MTITMEALVLSLLVIIAPVSFGKGVASMTAVTVANGRTLGHQGVALPCNSRQGRTFVDLIFRPRRGTPFAACSITMYNRAAGRVPVRLDPEIHRAPELEGAPDGTRVFHVPDGLVDGVGIMDHLEADGNRSHAFAIGRGGLRNLAGLPQWNRRCRSRDTETPICRLVSMIPPVSSTKPVIGAFARL